MNSSSFAAWGLLFVIGYISVLLMLWISIKHFGKNKPGWCPNRTSYTKAVVDPEMIRKNQFGFAERHAMKYFSMRTVYPASLHPPQKKMEVSYMGPMAYNKPILYIIASLHTTTRNNDAPWQETPIIFCMIPHGVLPMGLMAYPLFSCLFNSRLCRWTTAPIVLKIPIISNIVKAGGIIAAQQKTILDALTKKEHNVGVILDGVAGMFNDSDDDKDERGFVMNRKGIVKIALKAGVTIVPVYQFGVTSLWTILVDPFGIMEALSVWLNVSIVPFYGRWGWPLGPPRRKPMLLAFGDPIFHPKMSSDELKGEAGERVVNDHHKKLVDGFQRLFDTHKRSYGWGEKKLQLV